MSSGEENRAKLRKIVAEVNLQPVFAQKVQEEFLFARMGEFGAAYVRYLVGVPKGILPATASLEDLLEEHARNPYRVHMLLEALGFQCSADILAMVWMTLLGSRILQLSYRYDRGKSSDLEVTLELPDGETQRLFRSREHWDAAVLRFAALSKADDLPMVEGFHPIWIPPQQPPAHDYYVAIAQGHFTALDVAPSGSGTPEWEVLQVYSKKTSSYVGLVSIKPDGEPVFAAPKAERDGLVLLELAWHAFTRKYGPDCLRKKPVRAD